MFNEESLRRDIIDRWGPAGAHVDVLDTLIASRQILSDQKDALLEQVAELRRLITAWADADDALVALFSSDAWDTVNAAEKRSHATLDALRKAVGR